MTKVVIFDVDGTLVDSQAHILTSMRAAFDAVDQPVPDRQEVLSIVGLSLPYAMRALAEEVDEVTLDRMIEAYATTFREERLRQGSAASPLYPGAEQAVRALAERDDTLIAIATGKSRRGLDALLEGWSFGDLFVTTQSADEHPSKPHPSMVLTTCVECGVAPADAVVIGDTTYDMEMAKAARAHAIGVTWGYHGRNALVETGAHAVIADFAQLQSALDTIWKG